MLFISYTEMAVNQKKENPIVRHLINIHVERAKF